MSSDSLALLAQRLQALSEDGIKVNPATANPGGCLQGRGPICGPWPMTEGASRFGAGRALRLHICKLAQAA